MGINDLLDKYYDEEEICRFLGCNKRTLQTYRSNRTNHPPFIKLGNKILYPKDEFHRWLKDQPIFRALKAVS